MENRNMEYSVTKDTNISLMGKTIKLHLNFFLLYT